MSTDGSHPANRQPGASSLAAARMPSTPGPSTSGVPSGPWSEVPARLRARGLRWTPQRRVLLDVLAGTSGHVTGSELVERCRELDPTTIPSTVYRTLDVLEELGIVRHAHGVDGREEFHVMPAADHGHLYCTGCRGTWEIGAEEAAELVASLRSSHGFRVELSHVSIAGLCAGCAKAG
jgi:Fur family ferric uptake transcriptional regulator